MSSDRNTVTCPPPHLRSEHFHHQQLPVSNPSSPSALEDTGLFSAPKLLQFYDHSVCRLSSLDSFTQQCVRDSSMVLCVSIAHSLPVELPSAVWTEWCVLPFTH